MPREAGLSEDERRLIVEWIELGATRDARTGGAETEGESR
jgi:hypothetical protein